MTVDHKWQFTFKSRGMHQPSRPLKSALSQHPLIVKRTLGACWRRHTHSERLCRLEYLLNSATHTRGHAATSHHFQIFDSHPLPTSPFVPGWVCSWPKRWQPLVLSFRSCDAFLTTTLRTHWHYNIQTCTEDIHTQTHQGIKQTGRKRGTLCYCLF